VSAPRYRFFAGKGGVGKTTCAAAVGLALARRGARTLVVSTDPAHSLGDALEMKLSATPRQIRGSLHAAEMNADRALRRWLGSRERSFRLIASRGTYLDDEDIDSLFRLSLPGVDELVALVELERLGRGFDEVVVDTAPTGHTLRLLQMPETLAGLAKVLDDLQAKHRAMAASLRGAYRRGAEEAAIDELRERAASLHGLLRDGERAEFHWVLLAEELSLAEARDGVHALRGAGMRVARLIANRLTPPPDALCALCMGRRAAELSVLREAEMLELPLFGVPDVEGEPRGLLALRDVAEALETPAKDLLGHLTKSFKSAPPRWASAERPQWPNLIAPLGVQLVFVGGKGGTGKTTVAATAALALAVRGDRVLLLSTDPAHSAGDALRLDLDDQEREIAPRLWARELNAARAFEVRRDKYRTAVDELFAAIRGRSRFDAPYDRAVIEDLIDLAPPGLDELFGLAAVSDALVSRRFDVIIVDTAPTGHALRLLQLVAKGREWLQVLLQILLKYRRVTGLGRLAKDLTETARELRLFEELLHDPARARFVAVTRAAALPRLETLRLLASLKRLRVAAPTVVVNALTPPGCQRCGRAAAEERKEIAALLKGRHDWVMLGAPAVAPPPRGALALENFGRAWTGIK
jgi:arsenite-transporting ATPase